MVEKEHVVRLIEKNVWRQPAAKRPRPSAGEGPHKSEEEAALDKEAADAIIKGTYFFPCSPRPLWACPRGCVGVICAQSIPQCTQHI